MNITGAKMKEQYEKRKEDMENRYHGNKLPTVKSHQYSEMLLRRQFPTL